MRGFLWIPVVLAAAVAGGFLTVALRREGRPGRGPAAAPAPGAPRSDTGATALAGRRGVLPADREPHPPRAGDQPGQPWGDYVGSRACAPCHRDDYEGWRDSFHSRTLYDVAERTVFGDFSGATRFADPMFKWYVQPRRVDGTFVMDVTENPTGHGQATRTGAGRPPSATGRFTVLYAFGNRRHQPYVTKDEEGRHWVLPVYWNDVLRSWQWDGWRPYVHGLRPLPRHRHRDRGHEAAGQRPGPDDRARSGGRPRPPRSAGPRARSAARCATGRGSPHVEAVESMGDEAYRAHLAAGGAPTIYDPGKDTPERRMQLCDMCHNFHSESQVTFVPSPTGFARQPIRQPSMPKGTARGDAGQFHPDGTHMSPCTVGRVFRESKMGRKGVECRDCHDSHGNADWAELVLPTSDNRLCLKCHEADPSGSYKDAAAVLRHTRHARGQPRLPLRRVPHAPRQALLERHPRHERADPLARHDDPDGLRERAGGARALLQHLPHRPRRRLDAEGPRGLEGRDPAAEVAGRAGWSGARGRGRTGAYGDRGGEGAERAD